MGGTPIFASIWVPLQTLLDYLKAGESINDFLEGFPTVTREQVIGYLEEIERMFSAKFNNQHILTTKNNPQK